MPKSVLWLWLLLSAWSAATAEVTPDWPSLDSRPLPGWYDDAKIGIFMHFGPYSVPGYVSEWFWLQSVRNEGPNDARIVQFLKDYYPPKFTYQDFGPQLTMEFFNASAIADIVNKSGAKYLVFTSKHHDGYCNWNSTYSYGWNSGAVGPNRNVLRELKDAFSQRHPHIHFGLYYSLFEWFNPLYLKDKNNKFQTREYVLNKMLPEMTELVTEFSPHVLWVDGDWETEPEYWGSRDFLAWLYNSSPVKDVVVTNDRWGIGTFMKHGDFFSGPDRFSPGILQDHKWENAMTVDKSSWGYRRDMSLKDVFSPEKLILEVVKTVSTGGNILINVGPTKEGTIAPIFEERLTQLGNWLKINGEAIYESKPWAVAQNDSSNSDVWYTASADGDIVYALVNGWPRDDVVNVSSPTVDDKSTKITMLATGQELEFEVDDGFVKIRMPSMSGLLRECGEGCQWTYVLKLENLVPDETNATEKSAPDSKNSSDVEENDEVKADDATTDGNSIQV